ncbi:MAG: glutamate synthase subunit beta [Flavobacteriaceae bacterium]|nr:glutamate synthase subunit beta [Flavobacteriaceae bacterium]
MGKLKGFIEYNRVEEKHIPVRKRIKHYKEFTIKPSESKLIKQGGRCMDCGVPFCHSGCPLGNLIPDFNDSVYNNEWEKALSILHSTNNFPEFTGRLCPAPCEAACVLGIINPPVSIEMIEKYIVERGFQKGWIKPMSPTKRTGKKIAVIGSGPAGLAVAQQLNKAGHSVEVFERDAKVGGLLRYGIPDFKMEKHFIDRRINILKKEGIIFKTNTEVGKNFSINKLTNYHSVVLCGGATIRRKLPIKGAELNGIKQAMDFLKFQNQVVDGIKKPLNELNASGKNVIVIGGGDTGSDCIGTSNRQRAKSVTNFEMMPEPSSERTKENPWPYWPFKLKITTSHEEGIKRQWNILTKEFTGDKNGNVIGLKTIEIEWIKKEGEKSYLKEIKGSEKLWPCDLVLLALGFTGHEKSLVEQLGINTDERNQIISKNYQTSIPHIFSAGDMRRGQSLIVWAISEGREAAVQVDKFLMGKSHLESKEKGDLPTVR